MPQFIGDIVIPVSEMYDYYGRPIFRISLYGHEILFTKVIFDSVPHYVSFPVEQEDVFLEINDISYQILPSLPQNFILGQDNGENCGVFVLIEQRNGFFVENCVLHVHTSYQSQ